MTTRYVIEVDKVGLEDAIKTFEFLGGNTNDALRIAINKSAPIIRTAASLGIREQVRLSAAYVKERLVLRKATHTNLSGGITVYSKGVLLTKFSTDPIIANEKASWIRPPEIPTNGIRVKVKPGGSAKPVQDYKGNKPFYMLLNRGKTLAIAARMGKKRLPVKVFQGPSLSQVFQGVSLELVPKAGAVFQNQLIDAMRYVLLKKHPPEPIE